MIVFLIQIVLFWIFLSGNIDFYLVCCGIFSIFSTYIICKILFAESHDSGFLFFNKFKLHKSLFFLILAFIDISKSSIFLLKKIIFGKINKYDLYDNFMKLNVSQIKSNEEKTILAHYITSTPGSMTVYSNDNEFTIHLLYEENQKDLEKLSKNFKILKTLN